MTAWLTSESKMWLIAERIAKDSAVKIEARELILYCLWVLREEK